MRSRGVGVYYVHGSCCPGRSVDRSGCTDNLCNRTFGTRSQLTDQLNGILLHNSFQYNLVRVGEESVGVVTSTASLFFLPAATKTPGGSTAAVKPPFHMTQIQTFHQSPKNHDKCSCWFRQLYPKTHQKYSHLHSHLPPLDVHQGGLH